MALDYNSGAFNISLNDIIWFGSTGQGISLRHENKIYSVDDQTLYIDEINQGMGQDNWGLFEEVSITYATQGLDDQKFMIGTIKTYLSTHAITFEQFIVSNLNNTSSGDADGVITSFPVLDIDNSNHAADSSCLWTSWDAEFSSVISDDEEEEDAPHPKRPSLVAPGFQSPTCREWSSSMAIPGGIAGTGPMVIWSEELMAKKKKLMDDVSSTIAFHTVFPSFVLSPMENTMAINLDSSKTLAKPGRVAYG